MKIWHRSLILILLSLLFILSVLLFFSQKIILNSYVELEKNLLSQNVNRAANAITDELVNLTAFAIDWAQWDDSYEFIRDKNSEYADSNLVESTFANSRLNLLLYLDINANVVYGNAYDLAAEREVELPAVFMDRLKNSGNMLAGPGNKYGIDGLYLVADTPMLISAQPILNSEGGGAARGTLIMGRYLNGAEIEKISKRTRLHIDILEIGAATLPGDYRDAEAALAHRKNYVSPVSAEKIRGYSLLKNKHGQPLFILGVEMTRDIYQHGQKTIRYFLLSLALITFFTGLFLALAFKKLAGVEGELRESDRRYRVSVEQSNDAFVFTRNGQVIDFNKRFAILFGGEDIDKIKGKDITSFFAPSYLQEVSEIFIGRAYPAKSVANCETRLALLDGRKIYVEISSINTIYHGVKVNMAFIRDVTERKKLAEDVIRSQKLESLGVLAGGIAHDFNNLLTGIIGNINLARIKAAAGDSFSENLENAERVASRAQGLSQQLLTFAKGGTPIRKLTSVGRIVAESCDLALGGSNVRCDLVVDDDLFAAEVDESQIGQVVNNLIINAQQAMPEGGEVKINCENFVVDRDGTAIGAGIYVRIRVVDNGTGIRTEHLRRIFDPYFSTKQAGSGLGLASVFSIIEKHNGHITVDSTLGEGTIFEILLPASMEQIKAVEAPTLDLARGSGKILLMDDDAVVGETGVDMLTALGYQADLVCDGRQALDKYKEAMDNGEPYRVVIMDLTIPGGMGGKETIGKLLAIDPGAVVVVSSGYSNDLVMANYQDYGFKCIMVKPYSIKLLSEVMQGLGA